MRSLPMLVSGWGGSWAFLILLLLSLARNASAQANACTAVPSYGEIQEFVAPVPPATANARGAARGGGGRQGGQNAPLLGPNGYPVGRGLGRIPTDQISIPDAPLLPYKAVEAPNPPSGTTWGNLGSVGFLSDGHLIVFNRQPAYMMVEYDATGRLLRSFNANIAGRPHGMRIDRQDNIWITDVVCHTVIKMNRSGVVLMRLGTKGEAGVWDEARGAHLLNQPTDVAFAPNGDFFVTSGHGNPDPMVLKFDKTGKFLMSWPMKRPNGAAAVVHTAIVTPSGELWVSERDFGVINVYDLNGRKRRELQFKNLTSGLYIDSKGQPWVSTGFEGMVLKLDWNGKVLGWFGKAGQEALDTSEAHYLTISADLKTVYVADSAANKLHKYVLE